MLLELEKTFAVYVPECTKAERVRVYTQKKGNIGRGKSRKKKKNEAKERANPSTEPILRVKSWWSQPRGRASISIWGEKQRSRSEKRGSIRRNASRCRDRRGKFLNPGALARYNFASWIINNYFGEVEKKNRKKKMLPRENPWVMYNLSFAFFVMNYELTPRDVSRFSDDTSVFLFLSKKNIFVFMRQITFHISKTLESTRESEISGIGNKSNRKVFFKFWWTSK